MLINKTTKKAYRINNTKKVKAILSVSAVILFIVTIIIIKNLIANVVNNESDSSRQLRENICSYLQTSDNRLAVYNAAAKLNNNSTKNACVYFLSEVLRKNNYSVPKSICNTDELISYLKTKGWKKNSDYKKLKPGNICFTTDEKGNKDGTPSHTYIFMGWVKNGSYDYAYICDNQAKDYNGKIYHIRNISIRDTANGVEKDAFSFFMNW